MKEDKEMIKIPSDWLSRKEIVICEDDKCKTIDHVLYITEFAERENKGVQPVGDDIPVFISLNGEQSKSCIAAFWVWDLDQLRKITSWRPNIEELNKMYLAEQEENIYVTSNTEVDLDKIIEFVLDNKIVVCGESISDCIIRELSEKHGIDMRTKKEIAFDLIVSDITHMIMERNATPKDIATAIINDVISGVRLVDEG